MSEQKKLKRAFELLEKEHLRQYNIMLDQRILSMFKMWDINPKEKPMEPQVREPIVKNDVPPVEIRITIKQQDIGSTTSIFLKPNAFGESTDKWLASEITRVVEKVSEQFREEHFFNVEEKTSGTTPITSIYPNKT